MSFAAVSEAGSLQCSSRSPSAFVNQSDDADPAAHNMRSHMFDMSVTEQDTTCTKSTQH